MERLQERLEGVSDPEERIRIFILNHLEYFLANRKAMKVLSHEAEVLKNGFGCGIRGHQDASTTESAWACSRTLKREHELQFSSRIAVLSLFGMMNWIYTWHNPRVDADAKSLAREMGDIFLRGVLPGKGRSDRGEPEIRKDNVR